MFECFLILFSSSGLNAFERSIEIHLFGLAYTYDSKRMRLKKRGSEDSEVGPRRNRLQRE